MKKVFLAICLLGLVLTLSGCTTSLNNPTVTVENFSGEAISGVIVETTNNSVALGSIENGKSKTAELTNPFGESDIKLSYVLNGETKEWKGQYIESNACYKATLTINQDGSVDSDVSLQCY